MKLATKAACAAAFVALASVNALAYMQARAMTRFSAGGVRTASPERLGVLDAVGVLLGGVNVPRPRNARTPAAIGLPFEVHRFPAAHGPRLEAWYLAGPGPASGPIVLVFHGYGASKSVMLPVARALHELGYAALLVDFHGAGGSSGSGTTLGYLEGRDVAAAVAYAGGTWPGRAIVLYGFSMGGAAVLRAVAADGVRPSAVILEATFDTLLNTAKNRFRSIGLPATPLAHLLLFWGGFDWGFDPFSHNPVDYAAAVTCPALVLQGEADARVPPAQARHLRGALERASAVTFPAVPHMLIVTARPEEWRQAVGRFLAAL